MKKYIFIFSMAAVCFNGFDRPLMFSYDKNLDTAGDIVMYTLLALPVIPMIGNIKKQNNTIPPSLVFHNMGRNLFGAVTYNHGINFIGAGLGTWAFIETGIDWKWRNIAYDNTWLSNCGRPGLYIGFIVPALTPIITYITGRSRNNEKLQLTGLALSQSLLLTLAIQTPLKMITGRAMPGIVNELDHARNRRKDDFSGEFNWFNNNFIAGWPSGHTANAFAAAATISEIYKDNLWLKIGVYSYAILVGFGVTLNVHWA